MEPRLQYNLVNLQIEAFQLLLHEVLFELSDYSTVFKLLHSGLNSDSSSKEYLHNTALEALRFNTEASNDRSPVYLGTLSYKSIIPWKIVKLPGIMRFADTYDPISGQFQVEFYPYLDYNFLNIIRLYPYVAQYQNPITENGIGFTNHLPVAAGKTYGVGFTAYLFPHLFFPYFRITNDSFTIHLLTNELDHNPNQNKISIKTISFLEFMKLFLLRRDILEQILPTKIVERVERFKGHFQVIGLNSVSSEYHEGDIQNVIDKFKEERPMYVEQLRGLL